MHVTQRESYKYPVSISNHPSKSLSTFFPSFFSGTYRYQVRYVKKCHRAYIQVLPWDAAAAGEIELPAEL